MLDTMLLSEGRSSRSPDEVVDARLRFHLQDRWRSGYRIRLTHERSQVRSLVGSFFVRCCLASFAIHFLFSFIFLSGLITSRRVEPHAG